MYCARKDAVCVLQTSADESLRDKVYIKSSVGQYLTVDPKPQGSENGIDYFKVTLAYDAWRDGNNLAQWTKEPLEEETFALRSEGFGESINWSYLFFDQKGENVYTHREAKGWTKNQAKWNLREVCSWSTGRKVCYNLAELYVQRTDAKAKYSILGKEDSLTTIRYTFSSNKRYKESLEWNLIPANENYACIDESQLAYIKGESGIRMRSGLTFFY